MGIKDFIYDMQSEGKRVDEQFNKIPRKYYWVWGGLLPAVLVTVGYYVFDPNFLRGFGEYSPIFFTLALACFVLVFASISVIIIMFGIMIVFTIKDNHLKIMEIRKSIIQILSNKNNDQDETSKVIVENLRKVIREELEKIWKKEEDNFNKKAKQGLNSSNQSYQNHDHLIAKIQEDVQNLSANVTELTEEVKKLKGE